MGEDKKTGKIELKGIKTRRQWVYDNETGILSTKEKMFDISEVSPEAGLFLKLYGCKQYLADVIASKGGTEYSDKERATIMQERFGNLCNDKFKLTHTESGFYFKDPDAVATKRGGIKRTSLIEGLMEDFDMTEEEALAFAIKISQK